MLFKVMGLRQLADGVGIDHAGKVFIQIFISWYGCRMQVPYSEKNVAGFVEVLQRSTSRLIRKIVCLLSRILVKAAGAGKKVSSTWEASMT